MTFGRPHRHLRVCESTNAVARELAAAGAPGGTVVTAGEQTAGRGRHGRTWTAPPGKALLYSAILRPLEPHHALLPLAVPQAVAEAVERFGADECGLKWPNDVWIEGRKVAGVLIEARPQDGWAAIGVGLNVAIEPGEFPPELRETAVSVNPEAGATVAAALAHLNTSLARWTEAEPEEVAAGFRRRDALRGSRIGWDGGEGTAAGIAENGNLLVRTDDGELESLGAGEVHLSLDGPSAY